MLVGFKSQNHPQQVDKRGNKVDVDDRTLPSEEFSKLNDRFGFTIDVAAASHNARLPRYYSIENDGLVAVWSGERVYCNPPFSNISPWLQKAWSERQAEVIVMILPANRTEQGWWHEWVEPFRDRPGSVLTTEFIRGRTRFIKPGKTEVGPNERPPFGCVLAIWRWGMSQANLGRVEDFNG